MKRAVFGWVLAFTVATAELAAQPPPATPSAEAAPAPPAAPKTDAPKGPDPKAGAPKDGQPKTDEKADEKADEKGAGEENGEQEEENPALPPGHPPMEARSPLAGQVTREGLFRPAPDQVQIDKSLPPGTIAVQIVDADGEPVADAPLVLHALHSSVTKGESRERIEARTDGEGTHLFRDLPMGSGISYQLKSQRGEAIYASQPFGLRDEAGIRVILHVYDPVADLGRTALMVEAVVLLDIKENRIAVNHLLAIHNFGKKSFATEGLPMPLPPDATAFQPGESTGEQRVEERDGALALVGTFPPGSVQITYGYQVPLDGGTSAGLELPLPPRLLSARVVVGASESMSLTVAGFPPATRGRWHDGKRILQTAGRPAFNDMATLLSSTAPTMLHVTIAGIPRPGWGRWAAVFLAVAASAGGVFHLVKARRRAGLTREQRDDLREAKTRLLGEMALLERARESGEIGPRTYERLRLALTDALARIVAQLDDPDEDEADTYRDAPAEALAAKRRKKRKKASAAAET